MNFLLWITMFLVVMALIYDIRFGRIPNWLTFPAMISGLAYHSYINGIHGLLFSSGGLIVGFGIFISFYLLGGMGAGDVKLMAAIGALLGPGDVLRSAVLTAIAGGIYSAVLLVTYDFSRTALGRYWLMAKTLLSTGNCSYVPGEKKLPSLRYGIAIATGTLVVLLGRFV